MTGALTFTLNPALDAEALATRFASAGRVRVAGFLEPGAALAVHQNLRAREDWRQVVNSGGKVFELDRPTRAAMTPDALAKLDAAVHAGAREGFQHRYEAIRLPDGDLPEAPAEDPLAGFARWLSSGPPRDLLRRITGQPAIAFADGQATAYAPGDFLTGHDDAVPGKGRLAAYVFGLTPVWRTEWGGLLLFHGEDGAVSGETPAFNTLDLFAVPQLHSVSTVTPAAAYRRYAITGWLRAKR